MRRYRIRWVERLFASGWAASAGLAIRYEYHAGSCLDFVHIVRIVILLRHLWDGLEAIILIRTYPYHRDRAFQNGSHRGDLDSIHLG